MKKLLFLLLPLFAFGQSVIYEGIEFKGVDGMKKAENELMWFDLESSIQVVPLGAGGYSDDEIRDIARGGNVRVKLAEYTEMEIDNNMVPFAIFKLTDEYSKKIDAIGIQASTVLRNGNNFYLLIGLVFSKEKTEKDEYRISEKVSSHMQHLINLVTDN